MIGMIIKYMRRTRNLKQTELSKVLNIGQTTLSGWERGFREPNFDMIFKIAKECDYEILIKDKKTDNILTINQIKRKDI